MRSLNRFLLLAVTFLPACASTRQTEQPPLPELEPISITEKPRDTAQEKAFWEAVSNAQVIYVAERHDDDAIHEYQFNLIRSLRSRGIPFAIGWEMFEVNEERRLQEWQAKKMPTSQFLKEIGWQKSWGVYSQMYEQMLRWALSAQVECVALNAPRSMSKKIVSGEPFTEEERKLLPRRFHTPVDGLEHFQEQMAQHAGVKGGNLEKYYRAQQLWEQTMASRIVAFLEKNPAKKLVVFLGRGHASDQYGVPFYVRQRGEPKQLILTPGETEHRPLEMAKPSGIEGETLLAVH